jgi:hypothetical protein
MGPSGADLMTAEESIDLASLTQRAAMLAGVVHRLGPSDRTEGEIG